MYAYLTTKSSGIPYGTRFAVGNVYQHNIFYGLNHLVRVNTVFNSIVYTLQS